MNNTEKPRLPDTTFIVDNATEAAWIVDKLKEVYKEQKVLSCLPVGSYGSVGFIYTTRNYKYGASNDLQIEWNSKTSFGLESYTSNKVYKVSNLMTPLEDGAYQIEQTPAGKEWLEMLLLKFLLQGAMDLKEYVTASDHVHRIKQLRKGDYKGSVGNKSGWDCRENFDYKMKKIYQYDRGLPKIDEITPAKALPTNLADPFKTKYLVKINSTYTEVYIVPNVKIPNSNPNLVRVVDLIGEQFYWVYKKDLFTNTLSS